MQVERAESEVVLNCEGFSLRRLIECVFHRTHFATEVLFHIVAVVELPESERVGRHPQALLGVPTKRCQTAVCIGG